MRLWPALPALLTTLALVACGSDDDTPVTSPGTAAAPTSTTTISGAVVKGPVAGAQVCGYSVSGSTRGTALGSCTTTDASGNYSFSVPVGTGPLWVEATGGTYTDEVSATTVSVPAGSPLLSLITANGATVTTMITPLTTLAFNTARSTAGASGTLDASAYATAVAQLLSTFNLPAGLDINTTAPVFGTDINSYGTALTAISRMVANGSTLATILATTQPALLATAYATAAAPLPSGNGGGGTGEGSSGSPSASGSLTVAGVSAAGAATSLTPQADGFEVALKAGGVTSYRFFRVTSSPATRVEVTVSVAVTGATSVSYYDLAARTTVNSCTTNCGLSITPTSGATHPVTVAFNNTPLSGGLTLNGSLVGDAPGAAWRLADLPGGTSSSLTLGGTNVSVLTSSDSVIDAGGGTTLRVISLGLSDGSVLSLSQTGNAAFTVGRVQLPATISSCSTACNTTVADSTGTRITFANTPLGGGLVLNGTVDYGRTSGSLTSNDAGSFTPTASNIESLNGTRTLTFNVLGTAAQAGLSLVTVEVNNGRVVRVQATVGIATQVLSCFDNGTGINVPACSGITLGSDGRSLSFSNTVLYGGAIGAAGRNVSFNGTLVAKGF
jgi:hypothetical protein